MHDARAAGKTASAGVEIAGGVGLLVGLAVAPVGVAAAAGLLASGARPAERLERAPNPDRAWPELLAAACAQDDAHVIKLTHAAWRLARRWPDPAWQAAVERAIPV